MCTKLFIAIIIKKLQSRPTLSLSFLLTQICCTLISKSNFANYEDKCVSIGSERSTVSYNTTAKEDWIPKSYMRMSERIWSNIEERRWYLFYLDWLADMWSFRSNFESLARYGCISRRAIRRHQVFRFAKYDARVLGNRWVVISDSLHEGMHELDVGQSKCLVILTFF